MVALFFPKAKATLHFPKEKCECGQEISPFSCERGTLCANVWQHSGWTLTWAFWLHVHCEGLKVFVRCVSRATERCFWAAFCFCFFFLALHMLNVLVRALAYLHCNYCSSLIIKKICSITRHWSKHTCYQMSVWVTAAPLSNYLNYSYLCNEHKHIHWWHKTTSGP